MSFNSCGDCKVCCHRYEIDDVFWQDEPKPKNTPCEKLCATGCSVYDSRPKACSNFRCIWLLLSQHRENFPIEMRPDQSGVMAVTETPVNNEGRILMEEVSPGSFDPTNMTQPQIRLITELAVLANNQDIPTSLLYRTYDWEIKKINIEVEQTIT